MYVILCCVCLCIGPLLNSSNNTYYITELVLQGIARSYIGISMLIHLATRLGKATLDQFFDSLKWLTKL